MTNANHTPFRRCPSLRRIAPRVAALLLLSVFLAVLMAPMAAAHNNRRVVRVAYPNEKFLTEVDDAGNYTGYSYEYLKKIAEFANWKLEYVTYPNSSLNDQLTKGMEDVASGKADLMGGMLYSDALAKTYLYPKQACGMVYTTLETLENNYTINEMTYLQQTPLRIAILRTAKTRNTELDSFVKSNGIDCRYVYCDSVDEQIKALKGGTADVLLNVSLSFLPNLKIVAQFAPRPFYFVSNLKNQTLIDELDAAILNITAADPYFSSRLQDKYFKNPISDFALSENELAFVKEHPKLQVLLIPQYAPFAFTDKHGALCGISVSILNDIGKQSGIQFKYHVLGNQENLSQLTHSGLYDIVIGPPHSDTFAEKHGLALSQAYLETDLTLFINQASAKKPKDQCTLALLRDVPSTIGYAYQKIKYYDNMEQCLDAVNQGEADYGYASTYVVDFYTSEQNYRHLNYLALSGYTREIGFYVPLSENSALLSLLNRYIRSMPVKDIHSDLALALSQEEHSSIQRVVQENPLLASAVLTVFLLLLFLIIAMIFFYQSKKEQNEKLQQANAAKNDFLSRMSHDMRTPMNGIIGLTGLTLDLKSLPPEAVDNLQKINESSRYLLGLINDTLDMNRMESNKIALNVEPTDLVFFFNQMIGVIQVSAADKHIQLTSLCNHPLLPPVCLDRIRVQQILFNILSNAIKFTPEGGTVAIRCHCTPMESTTVHAVVEIQDSGIGISPEFLPKIFQPFEQENASVTTNYGGTGLGLAIVKNLVELMQGTISVQSEKGVGTTFHVEIDFPVTQTAVPDIAVEAASQKSLSGKRILLCEDHPLNAQIATKLLEKKEATVVLAKNGQIAVALLQQSELDEFDAILMDIRMPVMDGLTAAANIRALHRRDAETIPIIAMTANAFAEDIQKSKAAGMNAHLAKPIEPQKLYQTLTDLIDRTGTPS